jgi:hypothetical protein
MTVDLERSLVALADSLDFPGETDLADRVVARLEAPRPLVPRPALRRVLALAAAAALVVAVVLVASPRARRAVADLLGIGGVTIDAGTSVPATTLPDGSAPAATLPDVSAPPATLPEVSAPAATFPAGLGGTAAGLADSAQRLGIPPPVPTALGPPAAVTFGPPPPGGELALVWPPSASLPPTAIPGVGALLSVFQAEVDEAFVQKTLTPGTTYERVLVKGAPGIWLAGSPHLFLYRGPDGAVEQQTLRLAGNTLIWTDGPFTYRLESALDRDHAIAVAETVPGTNS